MSVSIIDAALEHVPQIDELERLCFANPWTQTQIERCVLSDSDVFLAAIENSEILGYMGMSYVLDEGYVGNVAVLPACRRRGIGEALVRAMLERAASLKLAFLTLEVRESNFAARRLYEACGFENVGSRRKYYVNPNEDAILMTVILVRL